VEAVEAAAAAVVEEEEEEAAAAAVVEAVGRARARAHSLIHPESSTRSPRLTSRGSDFPRDRSPEPEACGCRA
jgi:hypothetical protein